MTCHRLPSSSLHLQQQVDSCVFFGILVPQICCYSLTAVTVIFLVHFEVLSASGSSTSSIVRTNLHDATVWNVHDICRWKRKRESLPRKQRQWTWTNRRKGLDKQNTTSGTTTRDRHRPLSKESSMPTIQRPTVCHHLLDTRCCGKTQ